MIPCGDIHHLRLTVTDVERSREFYTGLLGFQVIVESPPPDDPAAAETFKILFGGVVMMRGDLTRLPSFGIDVLSFEDPDGIQLELTAPVPADG